MIEDHASGEDAIRYLHDKIVRERNLELGTIETRRGFFDGERHRWPLKESVITITRSLKASNEVVSALYRDTGEVRWDTGECVRMFDLERAMTYTQRGPVE